MPAISSDFRRQLHTVGDGYGLLRLLKLSHASWVDDLRFVADSRDWTINFGDGAGSLLWKKLAFDATLPNDATTSGSSRIPLRIDNVARNPLTPLEILPPGPGIVGTLILVSRAKPERIEYSYRAPFVKPVATLGSVAAELSRDLMHRRSASLMRYDALTAPGMFEEA